MEPARRTWGGLWSFFILSILLAQNFIYGLDSYIGLPPPVREYPEHRAFIDAGEITFTWQAVNGAARYRFELARAEGSGHDRLDVWTARTSYTARGLQPRTTYVWCVRAVSLTGQEGQPCSYQREVTTSAQVLAPPAPREVFADEGRYNDRVRLFWYAAPRATYYLVERGLPGGGSYQVAGSAKAVYFEDKAVEPGARYGYIVRACNQAGCSEPSQVEPGWAGACSDLTVPDPLRPAKDALVVSAQGRVELVWSAVEGAREYEYQLQKLPAENRQVETGGSNRAGVQVLVEQPGAYRWRVRALDPAIGCPAGKWSAFSPFRFEK